MLIILLIRPHSRSTSSSYLDSRIDTLSHIHVEEQQCAVLAYSHYSNKYSKTTSAKHTTIGKSESCSVLSYFAFLIPFLFFPFSFLSYFLSFFFGNAIALLRRGFQTSMQRIMFLDASTWQVARLAHKTSAITSRGSVEENFSLKFGNDFVR